MWGNKSYMLNNALALHMISNATVSVMARGQPTGWTMSGAMATAHTRMAT